MLVTLIGKDNMYKVILPQMPIGNYWISDRSSSAEKKLISIEGREGKWQIISDENVKIINPKTYKDYVEFDETQVIDKLILEEYKPQYIYIESLDELFALYCSPVYEDNFMHLNINGRSEIIVGKNEYNHILFDSPLIEDNHLSICYENGGWILKCHKSKFGIFVNEQAIDEEITKISNWDIIFIWGLKIIMLEDSLFINNPANKITYDKNKFDLIEHEVNMDEFKPEEDETQELYSDDDYFSKAPRITSIIECEKVKIDPPPAAQNKEQTPLILTLGPMLSMGAVMMVSVVTSIDGLLTGTATVKQTIFALITAFAMLISMLLFPILSAKYQKRQKEKYEEKRQKRYKDYIDSKAEDIDKIMAKQREILFNNYPSANECEQIVLEKKIRLWERKNEEHDFLAIRLGIGDVPLNIDIQYPEENFSMEDDNLVEILNTIGNKSKILKDVPITVSLAEKNISSLIVQNDEETVDKFMKSMIMQLVALHSYEDLKLVFLLKENKNNKWDYVKMLPHIWNTSRQLRFFTDDYNEMKDISKYLEAVIESRTQNENDTRDYKSFMPYYLIVTDDYRKIKDLKAIEQILNKKRNVGFSIFCIADNIMQLPNECRTFINIENNQGTLFESEMSSSNQKQFTPEEDRTLLFEKVSQITSNIPIKTIGARENLLPNTYTFLEMYDVRKSRTIKYSTKMENE